MGNNYLKVLKSELNAKDVFYQEVRDDCIRIYLSGKEIKSIGISLIFEEDNANYVAIRSTPITTFAEEDTFKGLVLTNSFNKTYRFLKFVLDDDLDLCVQVDEIIQLSSAINEIMELLARIMKIADDVFPEIMRNRYARQ